MGLEFVKETGPDTTFNVVLYGPAGTGKTVGATSAPGPVLVVNAEGPGAMRKARELHGAENVHEVEFQGRQTLEAVYHHLKDGKAPEKSLVIDTMGEVYRVLLEEIGGQNPRIQDYGEVNSTIDRFVRSARDWPVNVVLVCHDELVVDDMTGETLHQPVTGGRKLPARITAQADVVAFTGVRQAEDGTVEYLGQVLPVKGRAAKDRSGRLGDVLPLDIGEWLAMYAGPKTGGSK